jgi:tetratricopeptide (TPR) repeat protein
MKKMTLLALCFAFAMSAITAQNLTTPPGGGNQKCVVTQYLGSMVSVTVKYNSPDVTSPQGADRTGKIWGQLVPYGLTDLGFGLGNPSPWRAGANENTTITFSHDVLIEGQAIAAGTYGLHLIAEESDPWTWIFSTNSDAWGSYFYEEDRDALRVKTNAVDGDFTEWLTYHFTDRQYESAELSLSWENKRIPMKIEVADMKELYYATMDDELKGSIGFTHTNWIAASAYLTQNDYKLDKALEWAEYAISGPFVGTKNWNTLQNKAAVQMKMEDMAGAEATMMEAVELPSATAIQIHGFGRQLIGLGMKDKALEVFEMNYKKFDGAWPTNVGMARGLSAIGKYDEALKYAILAKEEAPDQLNKDGMAQAVEMLEQKQDIN